MWDVTPGNHSYSCLHEVVKPPLPYFPGQQFEVRSHIPPAPTNRRGECEYTKDTNRERQEIHPLERCFLNPPLDGKTGSQIINLKIVETLRVGDDHNVQLALVQASNCMPALPDRVVAKFYDPLYFNHIQD